MSGEPFDSLIFKDAAVSTKHADIDRNIDTNIKKVAVNQVVQDMLDGKADYPVVMTCTMAYYCGACHACVSTYNALCIYLKLVYNIPVLFIEGSTALSENFDFINEGPVGSKLCDPESPLCVQYFPTFTFWRKDGHVRIFSKQRRSPEIIISDLQTFLIENKTQ